MVRFSEYFLNTLKEDQSSSEIPSYSLCLRASLIRKIASGIYAFLPIGNRVLKKIENIVRDEMNKTGAIELLLPAIQPADLWVQSGRWFQYGPELFRLKDRNQRDFCLGPTHEEIITYLAYMDIKSYKDLPVNLYQIQVKFRDEMRPRYGILRAREFIMKDAYSFSANEDDLDKIYNKMYECYCSIIERMGLKYFIVEAETGLIGGKYSHEFIICAENGEDELVYCPSCKYAANYEMAKFVLDSSEIISNIELEPQNDIEYVYTPEITNIKSLVKFLSINTDKIIKTMLLKNDSGTLIAALVRGDKDLNVPKLEKFTGEKLELYDARQSDNDLYIGFLGPVGLKSGIKIYADNSIKNMRNSIAGANKKNYHLKNVNYPRDFVVDFWGDFSFPSLGDKCINCNEVLKFEKGIEIGHIFKLGTKYSEKMGALFLDKEGNLKPLIMGCYGIGISRILSAAIEQLYDRKGIVWPLQIAPFLVNLIAINIESPDIALASEEIYKKLIDEGIEVIFDDRNVRAGVKFNDSDLIGIPIKLIVGKNYVDNKKLEIELRKNGLKLSLGIDEAVKYIKEYPLTNAF